MKIVALISLFTIIAASAAAIILSSIRIYKAGKADKGAISIILISALLIIIMIVNLIVVIPAL